MFKIAKYNGRQNLDSWINQVESLAALNDLDDETALKFARTHLSPDIRAQEAADEGYGDRADLLVLKEYLRTYLVTND